MKNVIQVTGVGVVVIGLFAFSYTHTIKNNANKPSVGTCNANAQAINFGTEIYTAQQIAAKPALNYTVRGRVDKPVTNEKLKSAISVGDVIPYYPNKWITGYNSVNITTSKDGAKQNIIGVNDMLSKEQQELLSNATIGTTIEFVVDYQNINSVTNETENGEMKVTLTVVPEIEAEYLGGEEAMQAYLQNGGMTDLNARVFERGMQTLVYFEISPTGKTEYIELKESSGNEKVDETILQLITNMPQWKPAKNANGEFVFQEFLLVVGEDGC